MVVSCFCTKNGADGYHGKVWVQILNGSIQIASNSNPKCYLTLKVTVAF